jgi:uncharacterized protein
MLELVFLIGLITGFIDSTVGAGGLISVPSLIFLGLPPQVAIATDRFGTIGQSFTAGYKFWKAKKIVWEYVPIFTVLSLVGALIGSSLLVEANPAILQKVVGMLLLALLPLILLKRNLGVARTSKSKQHRIIGFSLYFLLAVFGGFFGQGTGPLVISVLTYFVGLTVIEVLATNTIPWRILSVASAIVFAFHHLIDYKVGIVLLISMAIGGYVGAHIAVEKGDAWIKRLFAVFVIIASLKLLFWR